MQRALQLSLSGESQPQQSPVVDPELQQALQLSLDQSITPPTRSDRELEKALQLSLQR